MPHDFLGRELHHLMEYTRTCVSDVLERTQQVSDANLVTMDARLPHIFKAIILLNQCTISILLSEADLTTREARFRGSLLTRPQFVEVITGESYNSLQRLNRCNCFYPRFSTPPSSF